MTDKTDRCRICNGDHWALKCPYKDTGCVPNKADTLTPALDDKNKPLGAADDKTMADKTVRCRICNGDHWALKCPYKDTGCVPNKADTLTPALDDKNKPLGAADDKTLAYKTVRCRFCNGAHWALKCPYNYTGYAFKSVVNGEIKPPGAADNKTLADYTVWCRIWNGDHWTLKCERDERWSIFLSMLSESQEADLEELMKPFGEYTKLFLAKDKATGACKGSASIHCKSRQCAADAIASLQGHGYNNFTLSAEWYTPQVQQH